MSGFGSVWVCVYVDFVKCVGVMCRFCRTWVYMCGFCSAWVCVCVGFVKCGCVYVWVL